MNAEADKGRKRPYFARNEDGITSVLPASGFRVESRESLC